MSLTRLVASGAFVALLLLTLLAPAGLAESTAPTLEQAARALESLPPKVRRNLKETMTVTRLHASGTAKVIRGMVSGTERVLLLDESGRVLDRQQLVGPYKWSETPKPGDPEDIVGRIYKGDRQLKGAAAREGLKEMLILTSRVGLDAMSAQKRAEVLGDASREDYVLQQVDFMFMFLSQALTDD